LVWNVKTGVFVIFLGIFVSQDGIWASMFIPISINRKLSTGLVWENKAQKLEKSCGISTFGGVSVEKHGFRPKQTAWLLKGENNHQKLSTGEIS
jgi:hypothetical protein